MRRLLVSAFVSLVWVVPALAQGAPQLQTIAPEAAQETVAPKALPGTVAPNTAQDRDDTVSQGVQSIERSVQTRLALAGFTEIQMVPTSFLVRAKDRDGNPVMLVLSPDSIAELQEALPSQGSGQDDGSSGDAPSVRPPTTLPGATDAK